MSSEPPVRLHLLRDESAEAAPAEPVDPVEPVEPVAVVEPVPATDPEPERPTRLVSWEAIRSPSPRPDRQDVENEIVGFVCDLVAAPPAAVGTVATSLFEAALLVVRGARDARPDIERPTLVLPSSAHPAYADAAAVLGVAVVPVLVGPTGTVAVDLLAEAVTRDTVLVVASAPSYAHGVVDPVARLGGVAMVSQVPLHVDASQGGWLLTYNGGLGRPWGMDVPGVVSVTLDVAPEVGTDLCVTVFRSAAHRTPSHLAATVPHTGGWGVAPPSVVRAARTLRELDVAGCADHAEHRLDAARALLDGLPVVLGLEVVAEPASTTVSLRADDSCDVFTVADELRRRRQPADLVLSAPGRPALLRVEAPSRPELVTDLLAVLSEATAAARAGGPARLDPALELRLRTVPTGEDAASGAAQLVAAAMVLDRLDSREGEPQATRSTHLLLDAADLRLRPLLARACHDLAAKPVRHGPERQPGIQTPDVVRTDSHE